MQNDQDQDQQDKDQQDETYKGRKPPKRVKAKWLQEAIALIAQANSEHREAQTYLQGALLHARNAGEALLQAKRRVPYTKWSRFRAKFFAGSKETSCVYMRIARRWNDNRLKQAREGNMEPESIEGFLAIIRNSRPTLKPSKQTKQDSIEMSERDLRKAIAFAFVSAFLEELPLVELQTLLAGMDSILGQLWERAYARLQQIIWVQHEDDARKISDQYQREWERIKAAKTTRNRRNRDFQSYLLNVIRERGPEKPEEKE